jgi:hypothetical protein
MAKARALIASNVAALKAMLPAASYLHLLHQGVMTGFLPRFDPEGKPTGQFDNLAPKDRVDMARYLLDKIVPDAPKELALVNAPASDDALTDPTVLRHLSSDELRRIALSTPEDTPADVDSPILAASLVADPRAAGAGPT